MMKKSNFAIFGLALTVLTALSGCDRIQTVRGGDEINFSGRASGSGLPTRATYAGDSYTDTDSKKKEHIFWAEGDAVRIYCEQASHPNYADPSVLHAADYKVKVVHSDDKSLADIELDVDKNINGLHWNDNVETVHKFYGVYPSPHEDVGGICTGLDGAKVTGSLPQSQNTLSGALTSDDDCYTLDPDLKWQLMTATPASYLESTFPASGTAFLTFNPLTTAIRFTLENENTEDITIKELSLVSNGTQISGDFTINNVETTLEDGFPDVTGSTLTTDSKTVRLVLTDPVTLAPGKTFTFTFFLAPVSDVEDLYFHLSLGDDSAPKLRLGYTDGSYLLFPRCRKSSVELGYTPSGTLVVLSANIADWQKDEKDAEMYDGSALIFGDPDVDPWDTDDAGNIKYTD